MWTVIVLSSKSQFRSLVVVLSCRVRLRIRCAQLLDHPPASARHRMIAAGGAEPRSDRRLPKEEFTHHAVAAAVAAVIASSAADVGMGCAPPRVSGSISWSWAR